MLPLLLLFFPLPLVLIEFQLMLSMLFCPSCLFHRRSIRFFLHFTFVFINFCVWLGAAKSPKYNNNNQKKKIENNSTLSDNGLKQSAMQKYLTLIEDMNNFERINYENFLARGTRTVNDILKRNILKLKIIKASHSKYLINDKTVTANCF